MLTDFIDRCTQSSMELMMRTRIRQEAPNQHLVSRQRLQPFLLFQPLLVINSKCLDVTFAKLPSPVNHSTSSTWQAQCTGKL